MVFVEGAAESITSLDVEVVEWGCCIGEGEILGRLCRCAVALVEYRHRSLGSRASASRRT